MVSRFLKLSPAESEYFLLLVQHARAGTEDLRVYFARQLAQLRDANLDLQSRIKSPMELSHEAESVYYSRWYYAAIHVLITIPKFQNNVAIATVLKLPLDLVSEVIQFLSHWGLIIRKDNRLLPGPTLLHLSKDSPEIVKHHTNWRLAAISSINQSDSRSVHYSTVSSLSRKDFEVLRARMVETIENYVETVKPSDEEMLCCFGLDFFDVLGREGR